MRPFIHQERSDNIEDYTIEGRFGRRIKVDFYTRQNTRPDNLIITLFSANETSSHGVANDVFCRWYDLDRYKANYEFLTVMDSSSKAFRQADISRVASVSQRAELSGGLRNVAQLAGDAVDSGPMADVPPLLEVRGLTIRFRAREKRGGRDGRAGGGQR